MEFGKSDITGLVVGKLTVICYAGKEGKHNLWEVKCECGNNKIIKRRDLTKSNSVKSCGCLRNELLSKRMSGESHYSWKGGKPTMNGKGYLEYKYGELRGVREHRYIYEQHYGIKLLTHQNVHHINGDRTDNRIENLELWDTSQPSGQRVEDKIEYYFNLVKEYKDHPIYKDLIYKLDPPF
jgi:hypothetical protein